MPLMHKFDRCNFKENSWFGARGQKDMEPEEVQSSKQKGNLATLSPSMPQILTPQPPPKPSLRTLIPTPIQKREHAINGKKMCQNMSFGNISEPNDASIYRLLTEIWQPLQDQLNTQDRDIPTSNKQNKDLLFHSFHQHFLALKQQQIQNLTQMVAEYNSKFKFACTLPF